MVLLPLQFSSYLTSCQSSRSLKKEFVKFICPRSIDIIMLFRFIFYFFKIYGLVFQPLIYHGLLYLYVKLKSIGVVTVPECLVRIKCGACKPGSTIRYVECLSMPMEDFKFPPNISSLRMCCKAHYEIVPESLVGNVDVIPADLFFCTLIYAGPKSLCHYLRSQTYPEDPFVLCDKIPYKLFLSLNIGVDIILVHAHRATHHQEGIKISRIGNMCGL